MTKPLFRRLPKIDDAHKLVNLSDGYRVASECLNVAAAAGCSEAVYEALFAILQQEEQTWRTGRAT